MLEQFFKLKDNKTDVKTEVMAGVTTFMTMAYILAVNRVRTLCRDGCQCGADCYGTGFFRGNCIDGLSG